GQTQVARIVRTEPVVHADCSDRQAAAADPQKYRARQGVRRSIDPDEAVRERPVGDCDVADGFGCPRSRHDPVADPEKEPVVKGQRWDEPERRPNLGMQVAKFHGQSRSDVARFAGVRESRLTVFVDRTNRKSQGFGSRTGPPRVAAYGM